MIFDIVSESAIVAKNKTVYVHTDVYVQALHNRYIFIITNSYRWHANVQLISRTINVQFRNDDAAGERASRRPTGEDEVDGKNGEQAAVVELIVRPTREEESQGTLSVHVQQTGNCNKCINMSF